MRADSGYLALQAFEVLAQAGEATALEGLDALFAPVFRRIGFDHFMALEHVDLPQGDDTALLFGRPDHAFCGHYHAEDLARSDPRLRHMLSSTEPALLSDLVAGARPATAEWHFVQDLRAHGYADSYVWPVHLPDGRMRAVWLMGDAPPLTAQAKVAAAALAASYYAAGARLLARAEPDAGGAVRLRPRQIECLAWTRHGKSSYDTGRILGLSPRTVDEHLARACERLGVRTRVQAVARALLLGLL